MPPVDNHFFGHSTPAQQGGYPIPDLPRSVCADLADHAGTLRAERRTGLRWWRIEPGVLCLIRPVESRGRHAKANLLDITARTGLMRPYHLTFHALQCFHSASIVSLD